MSGRIDAVAQLAQVDESQVEQVSVDEVREALASRVDATVLEVATGQPAAYWRVDDTYYLDDAFFGDVCDIEDLRYDSELGLYHKSLNA